MRSLARFLVVFMAGLRMLAPPGVCLCELSLPLVRFLAEVFHSGGAQIPMRRRGRRHRLLHLPAAGRGAGQAGRRAAFAPPPPLNFRSLSPRVPPSTPDRFAGAAASTSPPRPRPLPPNRPLLI